MNTTTTKETPAMRKTLIIIGSLLAVLVIGTAMSSGNDQAQTPTTQASASKATEAPEAPEAPKGTTSQRNALRSAESYLKTSAFSEQGLIDQLSSEYGDGYSTADATWAVQHLTDVDWNEQAARSGKGYLDMTGFSRAGLIEQLSSEHGEKFTKAQATYAADALGL